MSKYLDMQPYKFELPFGTHMLAVQLDSRASNRTLEKLELDARKLANELHRSLNLRLLNSDTRSFNDTPLRYPLPVSPDFWDFLQVCVTTLATSNYTLLPFTDEAGAPIVDLDQYLEIDPVYLRVTKKLPLTLDGSRLLHAYIVDQLHEFLLTQTKIAGKYLIATDRLQVANHSAHEATFFTPRMTSAIAIRSRLPVLFCAEVLERDQANNLAAVVVEAHDIWTAFSVGAQAAHALAAEDIVQLHRSGRGLCTAILTDGTIWQVE